MTANTVSKFNVVKTLLRLDDLRTPQATTTANTLLINYHCCTINENISVALLITVCTCLCDKFMRNIYKNSIVSPRIPKNDSS